MAPREKFFLNLPAPAFNARYPHVIIEDNPDAADLIRAHPKCPRQTFVWSGEFTIMDERHDPMTYYVAAGGPICVPTTHVVVMER